MPIEGLTRQAVRQRVGYNLMGSDFIVSATTTAGGDTDSLIDNTLFGGTDRYVGSYIIVMSGETNAGEISRVSDMAIDTPATGDRDLTLRPALTSNIPSGMDYELWKYAPGVVNEFINDAITSVHGDFYKEEESVALHGDGTTTRFDLPSEFDMVNKVERRASVYGETIHECDATFDETTDSDFTQTVDTEEHKTGNSLKLAVAVGAGAGDFITDSISSIDLSSYTHLEGWIKSSVALDANDYVIHLDSGVVQADGTDLESLNVPAVSVDTWTYFRITLAGPEDDTAIVSIGIEMNVDKGAHTVYLDRIQAVNNNSAVWVPVHKNLWRTDREAQDLILTAAARDRIGYALMKLTGGSNPAQMTTDATTATVPESYLIPKATALMYWTMEGMEARASFWEGMAAREKSKFPPLVNVRKIA
jgi:hypothetical protein